MTGIIGRRPFRDQAEPDAWKRTEYGSTESEPLPPYRDPRGGSAFERLGSGILDQLRSTIGIATPVEIGAAARVRDEAKASHRYDQSAAAAIADRLSRLSDLEIRRALPDIGGGPIPRQEDLRWVNVATAAIDVIHTHVDHGADHRLSPELGRAARHQAIADLPKKPHQGDLATALDKATAETANNVRNYLSRDPQIDRIVEDRHNRREAELGTWLENNPSTEAEARSRSRTGTIPPGHVVFQANAFARRYEISPERRPYGPIAMPDFANRSLTPAQKTDLVNADKAIDIDSRNAAHRESEAHGRKDAPSEAKATTADPVAMTRASMLAAAAAADRIRGR